MTAGDWITLVKSAFYASLVCFGAGIAGMLGAILEIQILLWLCVTVPFAQAIVADARANSYSIYLLGSGIIGAKKVYDALQSVIAKIDDVKSACKKVPAIFNAFGIDCDTTFDKLQTVRRQRSSAGRHNASPCDAATSADSSGAHSTPGLAPACSCSASS